MVSNEVALLLGGVLKFYGGRFLVIPMMNVLRHLVSGNNEC